MYEFTLGALILFIVILQCLSETNVTELTTEFANTENYTTFYDEECGMNVSCVSTTENPNEDKRFLLNKFRTVSKNGCTCDLIRNACDIDCCCDPDCTDGQKQVFQMCQHVEDKEDQKYCKHLRHTYVNFSLQETEIQNNDLFCIVRKNAPPYYVEEPAEQKILYISSQTWPKKSVSKSKDFIKIPFRKSSLIWIVKDNKTIETFKINRPFISSNCIKLESSYLNNEDLSCTRKISSNEFDLEYQQMVNLLFISKPHRFNQTEIYGKYLTCEKKSCLRPNIFVCVNANFTDCEELKNSSRNPLMRHENKMFYNVASNVYYLFYHNGTEGLNKIEIKIKMQTIKIEENKNIFVKQFTKVVFLWTGSVLRYDNLYSGNPGYLTGKPILIGNLINNSIARDPFDFKKNFFTVPIESNRQCVFDKNSYNALQFNFNKINRCTVKEKIKVKRNNATLACQILQLQLFRYFNVIVINGTEENLVVGKFGNSNSSILEDWISIFYNPAPKNILNNITGLFKEKQILICKKLVTEINIDIYYAKINTKTLKDQRKIFNVTLHFNNLINKTFNLNEITSEIDININLETRIVFNDVQLHQRIKLAELPTLNIQLPYDFFYPFIKVNNKSHNIDIKNIFIVLGCFLSMFFI